MIETVEALKVQGIGFRSLTEAIGTSWLHRGGFRVAVSRCARTPLARAENARGPLTRQS
ncbi:hypothetical protein [Acuticoccus kalidii]|uniref:hypothetical protein n=1 Tax=Acuticoccus kalidii TaxID=2910977 RepID=UPI0034E2ACF3